MSENLKQKKNAHHSFLKPEVTSSNVLFCLSNSPKIEIYWAYNDKKMRKDEVAHNWEATFGTSLAFLPSNDLIDYQNSWQLFFCLINPLNVSVVIEIIWEGRIALSLLNLTANTL